MRYKLPESRYINPQPGFWDFEQVIPSRPSQTLYAIEAARLALELKRGCKRTITSFVNLSPYEAGVHGVNSGPAFVVSSRD